MNEKTDTLTEFEKEIFRRMVPGVLYFESFMAKKLGFHQGISFQHFDILCKEGFIKRYIQPYLDEKTYEPVENWREKRLFQFAYKKNEEKQIVDISETHLNSLEEICEIYGYKFISYLCQIQAWDGRRVLKLEEERRKKMDLLIQEFKEKENEKTDTSVD
jgi:hypothetical protein